MLNNTVICLEVPNESMCKTTKQYIRSSSNTEDVQSKTDPIESVTTQN